MKNRNKTILKWVIVIFMMLLLGWGMYKLFAFSFATMLFVAILFIALEYWFYMRHPQQHNLDGRRRRFAIMLVGCYGVVAIFAMSYYFYPSKEVFSNNDHHAIVVEGIETNHTNLLLAADDKNAFFDDHSLAGSIELRDISTSDSTATLHIKGAGMPVYGIKEEKKFSNSVINALFGEKIYYYEALDGQSNIHSWSARDSLMLLNRHNETVAVLKVNYDYGKHLFRKEWHGTFILEYRDNDSIRHDTSAFNGIIRNRYSLASLFPNMEPLQGVDLTKIELLRRKVRMTKSNDDDNDLVKSPFLVCHYNNSGLGGFRSGNTQTPIGTTCNVQIKLDGASHSIGLNSRIPDFRLTADTTGFAAIRYRMPMYRYLNTERYEEGKDGYYTFLITSTLVDENGEVNSSQIPRNILLYDVFDTVANIYQMNPQFIYFQRGNTREQLLLNIWDSRDGSETQIKAGERLPAIGTSEVGTNWIVSLDNFRDPSLTRPEDVKAPFSDKKLMGFILLLTLLCCLSLSIRGKNFHTYVEPIAYIVLLSLLAVRLTLLWRASVFPPSSGITLGEFNKWRTAGGIFSWTSIFSIPISCILLVTSILVIKSYGYFLGKLKSNDKKRNKKQTISKKQNLIKKLHLNVYYPTLNREKKKQIWPQGKRVYWLLVCLVLYALILLLGKATHSPYLCIGMPVILYFVTDFIINVQVGSRWTDTGNHSYAYFWLGLINMLIASFVIILLDTGYGLVFIVFTLISFIIRLADLWGGNPYNERRNPEGIHLKGVVTLAILIGVGIAFMCSIAIKFFTGGMGFLIAAGAFVGLFVCIMIGTFYKWNKNRIGKTVIVILSVFFTIGVGAGIKKYFADKPTANRVMVLADDPSKVLGKVSTTPDMTKFLQASLNDWVLEEYVQRGEDVRPMLGDHGKGYFKLQPHSNVGVSWMTQLTDLSVSRFIIAEQSNLVPILLILIFLTMTIVGMAFPSDRRWAKSLLVQIPLLLTIQSLLVWMAVTRRFVFVGQDFPMISLISRVNLCISIIEFFTWILTALIEYKDLRYEYKQLPYLSKDHKGIDDVTRAKIRGLINGSDNNRLYRYIRKYTTYIMGGVCVVLVFIIVFGETERHFGSQRGTYDVTTCVDAVKELIANPKTDSLNIEKLFQNYQNNLINKYNQGKPKAQRVYDITKLGTPKDIFLGFCDTIHYNPDDNDSEDSISLVFARDKEYGTFARAAFNDYKKRQVYHNDIDGLIYIVKKRFVEEDDTDVEHVRYTFGVTSRYFRQHLPTRIDKSWRGSVMTEIASNSNTATKRSEGNVQLYTIPATWTKDHHQAIIVKPTNNQLSVAGKYVPRQLKRNEAYFLSEDEVLTGRNAPNLGNYLARNVLINSQSQFIYPMQGDFYYARPLAEQIRSYMQDSMSQVKKDKDKFNTLMTTNSEVTLSIELTKNLVHTIDQLAPRGNVAVVVADGDGRVRAMVEHRKPRYSINPNDSRRIQFVEDSLKREGLLNHGHEAERFFGNKAILSLDNGPGSSQKPIVWTAVTTQYSGWEWNKLSMANINNNLMKASGSYYDATSFAKANIPLNKETGFCFRSYKSDEGSGNSDVDVRAYMRKSSNYYNAIMVYLGSHTKEELEAGKPGNRHNPLLTPKNNSWLSNNRKDQIDYYRDSLFPLIKYDENVYSFAKPLNTQNVQAGGILLDGLNQNFDLPTSYVNGKCSYLHKSMLNGKKGNYYAYPEFPFFNNKIRDREGKGSIKEVAREGVKMTALGKNSVWLVSPLKMAEMYGKLVSFNSNYRLTIDPSMEKPPYKELSTNEKTNDYLEMRNKLFIPGLNDVVIASDGTFCSNVNRYNPSMYRTIIRNLNGYYIYGKTGTIDGKATSYFRDGSRKTNDVEDHLLAIIITNKDLTAKNAMNTVDEYKDLRFYIIYIADFAYRNDKYSWINTDPEIINTVLQSKEFKQYMEGK